MILKHAVLIFAAEPRYHLKAAVPVPWVSAPHEFLRVLAMPPFFALASWAAAEQLRQRGLDAFLRGRFQRILVPLLAGVILLGSVIKFIELGQGRDLSLSGFRLVSPPTGDFGDRYRAITRA